MAQDQSSGVRRRCLKSAMKEPQARTKVVLRHLPPSISQADLLAYIDSKYAGCYTWFSFRPGKVSLKRQVLSRAYINFKKPEDVYEFYEDFDGHVFLNDRGTRYKVSAEYAPYQQIHKPRSRKDIREGTITKDPDYLEFLEMLGKPLEYLPSAEVQLARREAEKAALVAGGGKESVVVTPLMEFVRQRRAAKAAPQRSLSSKLAARSGGLTVVTSSSTSHKRCLERSRSGPLMHVTENSTLIGLPMQKDSKDFSARDHVTGQRREGQQQRKERGVSTERRKKEVVEAKVKKIANESVPPAISSSKGNTDNANAALSSKDLLDMSMADGGLTVIEEHGVELESLSSQLLGSGRARSDTHASTNEGMLGDVAKDPNKRDVMKRKQFMVIKEKPQKDFETGPASPAQVNVSCHSLYNQRHRPPISPRVALGSAQILLAPFSSDSSSREGCTVTSLSKLSQQRDSSGKNFSRVAVSPREQQTPSQQPTSPQVMLLLDGQAQPQYSSPQSERGGKHPPRPQNVRLTGKEQSPTLSSPTESEVGMLSNSLSSTPLSTEEKISLTSALESFSGSDRQDSRRVRNKDRPDRPMWTPRRRSDTVQSSELSSPVSSGASTSVTLASYSDASVLGNSQFGGESNSKLEKTERVPHRLLGKVVTSSGLNSIENKVIELYPVVGQHHSVSGKARYIESSITRSSRGTRVVSGNVSPVPEHAAISQVHQRIDSSIAVTTLDPKSPQTVVYNGREIGESHVSSITDKEKRKQDIAPPWNELSGGSHRSSERRRDRTLQHGPRDSDSSAVAVELNKPVKRGGSVTLGSNEKKVWVAVQKVASGTSHIL